MRNVLELYRPACCWVLLRSSIYGAKPILGCIAMLLLDAPNLKAEQSRTAPNVLFIVVDDMNDWTSYLKGHPQARTPNLDRFAKESVRFTQAYCNAPSCNPSRASVMLGKHPNSTGFYSNKSGNTSIDLRKYYPDKLTLPQFFRQYG